MRPVKFAIVGAGWRAEFFLRIARELPDRFQVTAMVTRKEEKARELELKWGVRTCRTIDQLLEQPDFSFVVLSVPRKAAPDLMAQLAKAGMPVLCETPPAADLAALVSLYEQVGPDARIQIAEQYLFQPNHAAQIAIARSGKLGTVTQAQISAAHDYHGISLIRQFLGVTFEEATIRVTAFTSPIMEGPGRGGPPSEQRVRDSHQVVATLDFGDKLGVYDFTSDQYFSWIRSPRVLVRGERGEINQQQVRYLQDYLTPVEQELRRLHAGHGGNLEGYYLKGILLGEQDVYRNPFIPGRLTDDELAVATCLEKMAQYAQGGPSFYNLAEASQDHYLALVVQQAVKSGKPERAVKQPWAR